MTQYEKHTQALNNFTDDVKSDTNVIALLLSGSLSYGTVWKRSDIDMTVIVRDGSVKRSMEYTVDEDGIEIHAYVMEVTAFKNRLRKLRGGQYPHSYFGKGTMVFSKDEALTAFFEDARKVGADDAVLSFICMIEWLLVDMYRAEKWITVFDDPLYSQRFLHRAYPIAADMVLLLHGENPTRESVLKAMELEPELMREIFVIPSTTVMTADDVRHTLKILDGYVMKHMETWSGPILKFLSGGEPRKVSECNTHLGMENLNMPLAYLAEKGILERVTMPSRIFKNSRLTLEEAAYIYLKGEK